MERYESAFNQRQGHGKTAVPLKTMTGWSGGVQAKPESRDTSGQTCCTALSDSKTLMPARHEKSCFVLPSSVDAIASLALS